MIINIRIVLNIIGKYLICLEIYFKKPENVQKNYLYF